MIPGARELNGTNQISLATHNSKREMRKIYMRYRHVSWEWKTAYKQILYKILKELTLKHNTRGTVLQRIHQRTVILIFIIDVIL